MKLYITIKLLLFTVLLVACDRPSGDVKTVEAPADGRGAEKSGTDTAKANKLEHPNEKPGKSDGMIDGTKWTLAALSASLDDDFTMDDARRLFGNTSSIEKDKSDDNFTIMVYSIDTPDMYEHGVRMNLLKLFFWKNVLTNATIGFSRYYGSSAPTSDSRAE